MLTTAVPGWIGPHTEELFASGRLHQGSWPSSMRRYDRDVSEEDGIPSVCAEGEVCRVLSGYKGCPCRRMYSHVCWLKHSPEHK